MIECWLWVMFDIIMIDKYKKKKLDRSRMGR